MKKQNIKKIILYILIILWMILIFIFSNIDSNNSNKTSMNTIDKIIDKVDEATYDTGIRDHHVSNDKKILLISNLNKPIRKLAHFTEYLILCILLINVLNLSRVKHKYIISIIICIIYAFTDEYHQTFINGRTGQILDVLIDSSGSLLGSGIYYLGSKLFNKGKK